MAMRNEVSITGYVANDPEIRDLNGGKQVGNFTVRWSEKVKEEWVTQWFRVSAWSDFLIKKVQTMAKGDNVTVHGIIRLKSYQDKTGKEMHQLDVSARDILVFKPKGGTGDDSSTDW